jgi:hypothetical protein
MGILNHRSTRAVRLRWVCKPDCHTAARSFHDPESPKRNIEERRKILRTLASAAGLVLAGCVKDGATRGAGADLKQDEKDEAEVTPGEDLMQEHGVLERVLLIYDECAHRIEHSETLDPGVLRGPAGIIRRFVEEYHEKQEEEFVFPRLEAARREVALVAILRRQHQRGREITDDVVRLSSAGTAGPRVLAAVGLLGCGALALSLPLTSVVGGVGVLAVGALIYAFRRRPRARGAKLGETGGR